MKRRVLWACLAVMALVVAAGGGDDDSGTTTTGAVEATTTTAAPAETTTTAGAAELGSPERPIQVLFVPSVDAQVIVSGGEVMRAALEEATGLTFEVTVPTSYAATIEEMCAAPEDTMGFIPGIGYILANNLCGVDVAFKAVRFGFDVYWAQFLVERDSDITTLDQLEGLTWAFPDTLSGSGYVAPLAVLQSEGITAGENVESGGHPNAALAVYRGEADFATTFFSPPLLPGGAQWAEGDEPDVPEDLLESCAPDAEDTGIFCGDPADPLRVLDARASARTDAPDIVQQVRILGITPPIPNDTLSFGPDFPADLRAQIEEALVAFAAECETDENCAWNDSIGNQDFYGWTSINAATDAEYDDLRLGVESAGISLEDLG